MIDLKQLNDMQRKAVEDLEGDVLVFAGAGSGKTRVLTMRIANIIESGLAMPWEILAITFTNKAAKEMKERITKLVGEVPSMWVCTIHSMCTRILRYDADKLGFDNRFSIYTDTEKDRIIKQTLKNEGFDDSLSKTVKWHISTIKSRNISIDEYRKINGFNKHIYEICIVYEKYQEVLRANNAFDFDDLLMKAYELLKNCKDVREKYAQQFKFIHIDEFQDTNPIQYEIVKLFSSVHHNFFAVGDDDQSIYGFRGANIQNILNFNNDFPNAKVYKSEQNYRSTKRILEVANRIISKNTIRADKQLWCESAEGVKVEHYLAGDENGEGLFVANTIKSLVAHSGYSFSDIAVLYRMNSLSRSFEQEFLKYNVPYKVFGGQKFYDRKEIKDLTSYLRAVCNPKDSEALKRIINVPKRGIGKTTVDRIEAIAIRESINFYEVLNRIDEFSEFRSTTKAKLIHFRELLSELINDIDNFSASEYVSNLVNKTQFTSQFIENTEENISRVENIEQFGNSVVEFEELNKDATIVDFLQSITLTSTIDDYEEETDMVSLATIHAVKGLEFKVVFVVGLDEKYMPVVRFDTTEKDIEEERRLMYVAVTRAMERLYLTHVKSRYSYFTRMRQTMLRSRFLDDVKDLVGIKERPEREYAPKTEKPTFSGNSFKKKNSNIGNNLKSSLLNNPTKDNNIGSTYKVGDKVHHEKFGDGNIVAVKSNGTICDIAFPNFGVKRLAIKYAPLKKI